MTRTRRRTCLWFAALSPFLIVIAALGQSPGSQIGREVAIPVHLQDGEEFTVPVSQLIQFGARLFSAKFTVQEGAGRPESKGTGAPIFDPENPSNRLVFPRNFNRLSSPDANSCSGCHNAPVPGAGGDRVTEVFVLAQRFDHLTFDHADGMALRGVVDESGNFVTMDNAFDERKTIGMNGSGFVEMLARQMTAELRAKRDATPPGGSTQLMSKGISFGTLVHKADGSWDVSKVEGLAVPSLGSDGSLPSLIIRPLHQVGNVVSIRQFSNNAFNHHHGMQSEERFGLNADPDDDGFANELTTADLTAVSMYQATLGVPGRVSSTTDFRSQRLRQLGVRGELPGSLSPALRPNRRQDTPDRRQRPDHFRDRGCAEPPATDSRRLHAIYDARRPAGGGRARGHR